MNIRQMMKMYTDDGLARPLVSTRVCQDIILKVVITIKRMNKYEKRLNYFKN